MKKAFSLFLSAVFLLAILCSCGKSEGEVTKSEVLDLTKLNSNLVFAEVSNMVNSPDEYVGKTVRMTGFFA